MADEPTPTQQKIMALLQSPSKEHYLALFDYVTARPDYDPYADDLRAIEQLFNEGKYAEAQAGLATHTPTWLLSPRMHLLAAAIAEKLNEKEAVDIERLFAFRCMQGILSTGDGTRAAPYVVTRVGDEYDVVMYQQKQLKMQSLVEEDGRALDQLQLQDGGEMWFDITTPFAR